jgi:uncharacterized protein YbjT (DUF2867 family)
MTVSHRRFPELSAMTGRFTPQTRSRLERALARALVRRGGATAALRSALFQATQELLAEGLDQQTTLDVLGALVEDVGRACGADRPSLLTGEPRWLPVRTQAIEYARQTMTPPSELIAASVQAAERVASWLGGDTPPPIEPPAHWRV